MDYLDTHLYVQPNPQAEVYASHDKATPDVWVLSKLWVGCHQIDEAAGAEDVQHQVDANKAYTGADVGQAEEHTQRHDEVQRVLEVGPLLSCIQRLAVTHPEHSVVCQVGDVPEQQQGSVVVVDQDVSVGLEEASHLINSHINYN